MSYIPASPPSAQSEYNTYLDQELMKISQVLNMVEDGIYEIHYKPPLRFIPGLVVYADGVEWNPGGGEGLYRYSLGSTWVKIG